MLCVSYIANLLNNSHKTNKNSRHRLLGDIIGQKAAQVNWAFQVLACTAWSNEKILPKCRYGLIPSTSLALYLFGIYRDQLALKKNNFLLALTQHFNLIFMLSSNSEYNIIMFSHLSKGWDWIDFSSWVEIFFLLWMNMAECNEFLYSLARERESKTIKSAISSNHST